MRVLVVGGGAREHALAARLSRDPEVDEVVAVPGNPGIEALGRVIPADLNDVDAIAAIAARERIDMTVVGPEAPLSAGLADRFASEGRLLFGPTAAAARLETSKAFAKDFMTRHGVPTARFTVCRSPADAFAAVAGSDVAFPVVVKADGLAAGKGVVVAEDRRTAEAAIAAMMTERRFGRAGDAVVVEECLQGSEASFFVVSDGERALPIGAAQDHKRIFDDDRGPNTGGMGAVAPTPLVDRALEARIMREIVEPVIRGMAAEGHPFRGFLYVGLMLTAQGPKVIEFNVRLGDPEAQVILPLIDEPLTPLLVRAAMGSLRQTTVRLERERLVGVVLASRGYPESSSSGQPIEGIDRAEAIEGVSVYHAGTARRGSEIVTAGGRVLTVVGRGATFADATARAYAGVLQISFEAMQYRRDIGRKALQSAIADREIAD